MTDAEMAGLHQANAALEAENAELSTGLGRPRSPEEWRREARDAEAQLKDWPDERIEILCEAGNAWQYAEELDEADRCYRQAAESEHEPGFPDPRAYYASFLIEYYDAARGNELVGQIWDSRPAEPTTYQFIAETLELVGEYQRALTWVNAGLSRCYPQPFSPDVDEVMDDQGLDMLIAARSRVRQELQQPEDSLDELNRSVRAAFHEAFDSYERRHPVSRPAAVLYWPEAEFADVMRRWPEGGQGDASTHAEHRAVVEGLLQSSAQGNTPVVVGGTVAEYDQFCHERERDPSSPSSRDDYAAWLAEHDKGISWPPGRNDPCWCGAGRKYKKCCGAPGFVETGTVTEHG